MCIAYQGGKNSNLLLISDSDIDNLRNQLGLKPDLMGNYKETVAVGRCNIPGLENEMFTGASVIPRREAGLADLDEVFPDRSIVAPVDYKNNSALVQQAKHAEENVMAEFETALKKAGIRPEEARADFYIMQSNPNGACPTCMLDMLSPSPKGNEGIFKQFSKKYPNVNLHLSTYKGGGLSKGQGVLSMDIVNGQPLNVVKTYRGKIIYK